MKDYEKIQKKLMIIVCILIIAMLIDCLYIWLTWRSQINRDTYYVGIPMFLKDYVEEVRQNTDIAVMDAYILEEGNYDFGKDWITTFFNDAIARYKKPLYVLSKYLNEIDTINDYFIKPIDCSTISIPMNAGYFGMNAMSKDLSYDENILDELGLDEFKSYLNFEIYVWNEEYELNSKKPFNKMNYVFKCDDKVIFYSFVLEGRWEQKGNYKVCFANIRS